MAYDHQLPHPQLNQQAEHAQDIPTQRWPITSMGRLFLVTSSCSRRFAKCRSRHDHRDGHRRGLPPYYNRSTKQSTPGLARKGLRQPRGGRKRAIGTGWAARDTRRTSAIVCENVRGWGHQALIYEAAMLPWRTKHDSPPTSYETQGVYYIHRLDPFAKAPAHRSGCHSRCSHSRDASGAGLLLRVLAAITRRGTRGEESL